MKKYLLVLALAAGPCTTPALAADRARVTVTCKAAAEKLVYDCVITLANARTGAPLDKAEVTVGADMPSMPMAHNVSPVSAKPAGAPGQYQAQLALEMHGDWAVQMKIAGPLKDQVVRVLRFDETGSGPPARRSVAPSGGHKH